MRSKFEEMKFEERKFEEMKFEEVAYSADVSARYHLKRGWFSIFVRRSAGGVWSDFSLKPTSAKTIGFVFVSRRRRGCEEGGLVMEETQEPSFFIQYGR